MEDGYLSMCLICFEQFLPPKIIPPRKNFFNDIFLEFCEELCSQSPLITTKKRLTKKGQFSGANLVNLVNLNERISLCLNCQSFISAVVNSREAFTEKETRVRQLQLELLKEMKQLQGQVEEYYLELKKLESCVIASPDVSNLELYVERRSRRSNSRNLQSDILSLRSQILSVTNDLRKYRSTTIEKTYAHLGSKTSSSRPSKRRKVQRTTKVEESWISPIPTTSSDNLNEEIANVSVKQEVQDELELVHHSPTEFLFEPEIRNSDEDESDGGGSDYLPEEQDHHHIRDRHKKDKTRPRKLKKKRKSQALNLGVDYTEPQYDMHGVEFTYGEVSLFKQLMLVRHFRKLKLHQEKLDGGCGSSKPGDESEVEDTRKNFPFLYDHQRGSFFVGGIEVTINDLTNTLHCTKCGHEEKARGLETRGQCKPDHQMHHHLLETHLYEEAFKCAVCAGVYKKYRQYYEHMKGHKNKFVCDICGRPMLSLRSLRGHKWTHMNEEEIKEAEGKGLVHFGWQQNERAIKGEFPCSVCGKIFKTKKILQRHEKLHEEDPEMVVCPECGKSFPKRTYPTHRLYVCPSKEMLFQAGTRFGCAHCPKSFMNRNRLEIHMVMHSNRRPFSCSFCEKTFKHMKDKRRHEKQRHSEERSSLVSASGRDER